MIPPLLSPPPSWIPLVELVFRLFSLLRFSGATRILASNYCPLLSPPHRLEFRCGIRIGLSSLRLLACFGSLVILDFLVRTNWIFLF